MNRSPLLFLLLCARLTGAQTSSNSVHRVDAYQLFDSSYQRPRSVWVYTPPGYNPHASDPYPLIIAFDGHDYLDDMPLPTILDSLFNSGSAPRFVGVLIDDGEDGVRIADLGNASKMSDFMANQLVPWIRRGWRVTTNPHRVIVTGSSAGGLGAAYIAFMHPELFGNVWSQSGAFWRGRRHRMIRHMSG